MAKKLTQLLTLDDILGADDIEYRTVKLPEWGGSVRLRLLNGAETIHFQTFLETNRREASLALVRASTVDAEGKKLFETKESFEALKKKSYKVIRRISDECLDLNGLLDPGKEIRLAAKAIRDRAAVESEEIADRLFDIADDLEKTVDQTAKN